MPAIVQEIGALAGWVAGAGLAGLSALYVSHARGVRRLREWAGGAPERSGRPAAARAAPESPRRNSRTRHVAVALVGLVVLGGAAAYGVTQVTGGGDTSGNGLPDERRRHGSAVRPRRVTVAVLNGTTVPGLAAALRERLAAAGFKRGTIDVFSDQQRAESVVQYAPGHRAAGRAVGRRLGISRREPVTADSRALAGDATVIVIAGADKAP